MFFSILSWWVGQLGGAFGVESRAEMQYMHDMFSNLAFLKRFIVAQRNVLELSYHSESHVVVFKVFAAECIGLLV
jgi:hypothetical protein